MRICLINPPVSNQPLKGYICSQLGLGYISAYLSSKGYHVDFIDCLSEKISFEDIKEMLQKKKYDIYGISTYFFNYAYVLRIVRHIRKTFQNKFVFLGGYLPTLSYEVCKNADVDCVIVGEGEITVYEMLEKLNSGNWKTVSGIAFYDSVIDEIIFTGKRAFIDDLDMLPFPTRLESDKIEIDLITARGCHSNCSFCAIGDYQDTCIGERVRRRSPENVVQEIKLLLIKNNLKELNFADDCLSLSLENGKWINTFIRLIKENNIEIYYSCFMRVNEIITQESAIKKFIEIGLSSVFVGIESFIESHLLLFNKHVTVQKNLEALRILDNLGVQYDIGFILFTPITTMADIFTTVEIFKKIHFNEKNKHPILPIGSSYVFITEGTPIDKYIKEHQLFKCNEPGYRFFDEQVFLCYEVMQKWKKMYITIIHKFIFKKINRNIGDDYSKRAKLFKLFFLDLDILYDVAKSITIYEYETLEMFNDKFEIWNKLLYQIGF